MPQQTLPARFDATEPLPRSFGRLTLLKRIAQGGMGEVFLAASGGIDGAERPVVVKRIRQEHAEDRSFVARFLDEARVQSQLQHPGVAQILEASTADDGQPYVVVEYVEGRSLAEVRARVSQLGIKIEWAEAVAMCASITEALAHVHERFDARGRPLGIVHRDLSPQNVMVAFGGDTKLIDFGTARGENRRCHTVSGVVFAKPGYVAPEVANGIPGDARADLYALGVMLWELCAGRRFLQGDANDHMAAVAANKRPLPPIASTCGAPIELDRLLARLTAFSLKDRVATARSVHRELTQMLVAAPPMTNQERGVRARIAQVLATLYPHEPNRSRSEFQRLVAEAKATIAAAPKPEEPAPPKAQEGELFPGTRYRVVRKLGEGASAIVFSALHVDLQRPVAMKVLGEQLRKDARAEERFRREARIMAKLSHPNLAAFYDYGETAHGAHFIVMERVDGEPLDRWLDRKGQLTVKEAILTTRQLLAALETVHNAGVVHRDIKPANILVTPEGHVRLIDFGVASVEGEGDSVDEAFAVYGTHEYMAPEQATGGQSGGRADLYAVGCILYELLTGAPPHVASARIPLLEAKQTQRPIAPSERAPERGIPAALDEIVLAALATSPNDRPADARMMDLALDTLDMDERVSEPPPPRRRTARAVVAAIMAGAIAVSAFAAWGSPDTVAKNAGPLATRVATNVSSWISSVKDRGHPATYDVRRAGRVLAELSVVDSANHVEPAAPPVVAEAPRTGAEITAPKTELASSTTPATHEDIVAFRAKVKKALTRRHWDEARKIAETWVKAEASREARLFLARALIHGGKQSEGREVLQALLEGDPSCDDARTMLKNLDTTTQPTAQARAVRSKSKHTEH